MPPTLCPRPSCKGMVIDGKCSRCGAFSYTAAKGSPPTKGGPPVPPINAQPLRLMTAEQWKALTRIALRPRSSALKAVDRSLMRYENDASPSAAQAVREAFEAWIAFQGGMNPALMSARNHSQAVQFLSDQLAGKDVRVPGDLPAFMESGMENARLGIIYLFGNCEIDRDVFGIVLEGGLSLTGSVLDFKDLVNPTEAIQSGYTAGKKVYVKGKELLAAKAKPADGAGSGQKQTILEALGTFVQKVLASLKNAIAGIDLRDAISFVVGKTKALITVLADVFLAAAAPFISGGINIARGVAKAVLGAADLISSWWQGRGVEMLSGHPATIVQALRGAMARSLFEGLYETLKGVATLALDIAVAAAGSIVNLVLGIVEALAKMVIRLVETFCLSAFCKKAHENWAMRDDPRALHKCPTLFNSWYKRHAIPFPAIAALTLNSRICGDKMRFLKVMNDNDRVVSQAQFDKGCAFVDGLKSYAADYLNDCDFDFKSSDPMVKNAVSTAKARDALTVGSAIGEVVKQVFVA